MACYCAWKTLISETQPLFTVSVAMVVAGGIDGIISSMPVYSSFPQQLDGPLGHRYANRTHIPWPPPLTKASVHRCQVEIYGTTDPACVISLLSAVEYSQAHLSYSELYIFAPLAYSTGGSSGLALYLGLVGHLSTEMRLPLICSGAFSKFDTRIERLSEIEVEPIGGVLVKALAASRKHKLLVFNAGAGNIPIGFEHVFFDYSVNLGTDSLHSRASLERAIANRHGLVGIQVTTLEQVYIILKWVSENMELVDRLVSNGAMSMIHSRQDGLIDNGRSSDEEDERVSKQSKIEPKYGPWGTKVLRGRGAQKF